jgi:hypothetical protein
MVRGGRATGVLLAAVVANGLLVGASLDQPAKQLPARHRIGPVAFAAYGRAADLRNGVPWYATLGLGTAGLTLAAAAAGRRDRTRPARLRRALALAAGLTVGHLLVTAVAAPVNFSQRGHNDDPAALERVFGTFARLTALRAGLQAATLAAVVWALATSTSPSSRPAELPSPSAGHGHPRRAPTDRSAWGAASRPGSIRKG